MGERREARKLHHVLMWVRHLKRRPFLSLLTMSPVISPEVTQLTFGAWSIQDKVALERSQ